MGLCLIWSPHMNTIKTIQKFISDYLPIKISKENIRFILIFLTLLFTIILLTSLIEYNRQNFWHFPSQLHASFNRHPKPHRPVKGRRYWLNQGLKLGKSQHFCYNSASSRFLSWDFIWPGSSVGRAADWKLTLATKLLQNPCGTSVIEKFVFLHTHPLAYYFN